MWVLKSQRTPSTVTKRDRHKAHPSVEDTMFLSDSDVNKCTVKTTWHDPKRDGQSWWNHPVLAFMKIFWRDFKTSNDTLFIAYKHLLTVIRLPSHLSTSVSFCFCASSLSAFLVALPSPLPPPPPLCVTDSCFIIQWWLNQKYIPPQSSSAPLFPGAVTGMKRRVSTYRNAHRVIRVYQHSQCLFILLKVLQRSSQSNVITRFWHLYAYRKRAVRAPCLVSVESNLFQSAL